MRILMLAQFYPPTIGGVERHVRDLSIELAARGHDVSVATLWHKGMPEFEIDQGVQVYRVKGLLQRAAFLFSESNRRHLPPCPDPGVTRALYELITQQRPDIIHAHNWMVHSFTPLKAWSKAKLVVTLHDCSHSCAQMRFMHHGTLCSGPALLKCLACASDHYGTAKGTPTALSNWLWGKIERQTVDMFLPVSQAMVEANQLTRYKVPYRVIPNFISDSITTSCPDYHPFMEQLPGDNYLLFVGDIARDKGVGILLQAYADMKSPVPLVLIGRPVDDFSMHLPGNVLLLQNWPHEAVMMAWSRCSIALLPSLCLESFGIVILEAMSQGRPVVASRIGGISDIVIDGETGLLVPPGDRYALQQTIQRLLDDSALREHMGILARQRVAEFQAKTVIPRIEQTYYEVLQH